MRKIAQRLLRFVILIAVTLGAGFVMWWSSRKNIDATDDGPVAVAAIPALAESKPLVAVQTLSVESRELTATFTGKIRPWETFVLAFEQPGRVVALGENENGTPLDDGDEVRQGQTLARLDDRVLKARKSEAAAKLEEATSDMNRVRQLRERNLGAITDTEFQEQLTELALARAQQEVAIKELDDAVLTSPVNATISRRMINAGESVQAHQVAFELVQLDKVLLVVDVPESRIYELQDRLRQFGVETPAGENVFRAYVTLEGRDRFGRQRPDIEAEVYRIAQVADARTGLFEVEIMIPNPDLSLRPGMVATARIVVDRIPAYSIPESAVIFRNREAYVYAIERTEGVLPVMFWQAETNDICHCKRVDLTHWIDQGAEILVPATTQELGEIVVRGQQRLSDGQLVRIAAGTEQPEMQQAARPMDNPQAAADSQAPSS